MPAVNGVGEPCAGEPHARFEVAGAGGEGDQTTGTRERTTGRETGGVKALGPTVRGQPSPPVPDPTGVSGCR